MKIDLVESSLPELAGFQTVFLFPPSAQFHWSYQSFLDEVKTNHAWGLWTDSTLCAICVFRRAAEVWDLTLTLTHPAHRGRGMMKKLLGSLVKERLPALGAKRVWLEVHEGNFSAIRLYSALGFAEVGRRTDYYQDGGTAVLMEYVP